MTFFNHIESLFPYLKSIRKLKGYLTFDIEIPEKWKIPKKYTIEGKVVEQQKSTEGMKVYSFVAEFSESEVDTTISNINSIVEFNKEIEQKEVLFLNKVDELKKIFERQDLNKLQSLKFELNEFNLGIEDDEQQTDADRVVTE
jgi:hypothetical protein